MEARVVLTDKVTVVNGTLPSDRMTVGGGAIPVVADAFPPGTPPARYPRILRPHPQGHFKEAERVTVDVPAVSGWCPALRAPVDVL